MRQLAARAADVTTDPDVQLTIGRRILGPVDREWHVVLDEGTVRVESGPAAEPTLRLTSDSVTADAIHRGELSAQRAFLDGNLRIDGDLRALLAARPVLDRLASDLVGLT